MNLDTKVIGYSCFLHLNKKNSYQSLNVDCPPIGETTYFQPYKSKEIWRSTLVWRGTREECLEKLVKYERWTFQHLLQAGDCKNCRWKMTEEEFELSYELALIETVSLILVKKLSSLF